MKGYPIRHTARLIILDPADRILLIEYESRSDVDPARPGLRRFWFTPGGGIEPGETAEEAALREMEEEVGFTGLPLIGEVAKRDALNDMFQRAAFCHERYFLVRTPSPAFDTSRLAETDQDPVHQVRWWELDALAASGDSVRPPSLIALARRLIAGHVPATPVDLG